jgi:hypothetical protein
MFPFYGICKQMCEVETMLHHSVSSVDVNNMVLYVGLLWFVGQIAGSVVTIKQQTHLAPVPAAVIRFVIWDDLQPRARLADSEH